VLTWIVATMAATGLAWAGVRSVVADVAAPLPAPTLGTSAGQGSAPAVELSPVAATPRPDRSEPAQGTTRAFQLAGGTATVRFTPETVTVLSAVPASGFSTDVGSSDDHTRVEFESDDHRSRLEVWWADGPRHEVEEHAESGGGDDDRGGGDDDRRGSDEGEG
jgi:hypothetical protein